MRIRVQQLEPEQVREGVHGVALPLGVGVDRVRLGVRALFEESFDDVDGFPDAAGDEVREERDVVVGDVVVGDPAVAAVADVRLGQEVVDQRVDLGAVGGDRLPVSPGLDEVELEVGVDDVGCRVVELLGREVRRGGHAQLVRGDAADVAGGLCRAEVAAVGERRQHVAQQWVLQAWGRSPTRARTAATTQASRRCAPGSPAASARASAA